MDNRDQEITFSTKPAFVATPGPTLRAKSRLSARHSLFFALGLMNLFVLYHDEQFFIDHRSNTWKFFSPVFGKLMVHALGGATAFVLGAVQFSTRLRQRRPAVHRLCGRCYIAGVLLAAPMAVYL
jgi:hypothetical protein